LWQQCLVGLANASSITLATNTDFGKQSRRQLGCRPALFAEFSSTAAIKRLDVQRQAGEIEAGVLTTD
jgi:hypothetical protein